MFCENIEWLEKSFLAADDVCEMQYVNHVCLPCRITSAFPHASSFSFSQQMLCFIPVRLRRSGGYRYMSKDSLGLIFRTTWPPLVLLLSGFIIVTILTDLPKAVIGRLRPHFLTLCQPVFSGNCTPTRGYILHYKCLSKSATSNQIEEMR